MLERKGCDYKFKSILFTMICLHSAHLPPRQLIFCLSRYPKPPQASVKGTAMKLERSKSTLVLLSISPA